MITIDDVITADAEGVSKRLAAMGTSIPQVETRASVLTWRGYILAAATPLEMLLVMCKFMHVRNISPVYEGEISVPKLRDLIDRLPVGWSEKNPDAFPALKELVREQLYLPDMDATYKSATDPKYQSYLENRVMVCRNALLKALGGAREV